MSWGGQSSVTGSEIPGPRTPNHLQRRPPFGIVWQKCDSTYFSTLFDNLRVAPICRPLMGISEFVASRLSRLLPRKRPYEKPSFRACLGRTPKGQKWPRSLFRPVQARSWKKRPGPGWDQDGPGWPPPWELDGSETL